jgi:hypothetical protein
MLAVSRVHELTLPYWLQAGLLHHAAHFVTADLEAATGQRRDKPAATVALTTAHERGTQMHARFAKNRLGSTVLRLVESAPAYAEQATGLCDRNGLHLQLVDESVAHLSSRAKKADAFFNTSTSLRSCWFSCSSWRMPCCSAVNGLPMPGWPFCSASYCYIQRRIAVTPISIVWLTCEILRPCFVIIRTTSSLKLGSKLRRCLVM